MKSTVLFAATTALLFAYVALYYRGVTPYGPIESEERIPLIDGWSPSYLRYEFDTLQESIKPTRAGSLKVRWNGLVYTFFKPIHLVDRVLRKGMWLTLEEKKAEIYKASQPLTPFMYEMAVVQALEEPPQPKKGRKSDYVDLLGFDDGHRYHSFTNCTTANWKKNYFEISKILISKAKQLNLDTASLQQTLGLILAHSEDRIAYLPTSANQAVFKGRLSWIIRVRWEYFSEDQVRSLGHIRSFIYDQETMELLDYKTCN